MAGQCALNAGASQVAQHRAWRIFGYSAHQVRLASAREGSARIIVPYMKGVVVIESKMRWLTRPQRHVRCARLRPFECSAASGSAGTRLFD